VTGLGNATASAGAATKILTGNVAGPVTIKATASSIDSNTLSFNVVAGTLTKFAIATVGSPQTAGTPFSITITAQDANNNTVTGFAGTASLTTTAGTISPATSAAFSAGVR